MRWFWALTVAALVAMAGVRPAAPIAHDTDRAAQLETAHALLPAIARRDRGHAPDLQLPLAVVPAVTEVIPPPTSVVEVVSVAVVAPAIPFSSPRSSRGPPIA